MNIRSVAIAIAGLLLSACAAAPKTTSGSDGTTDLDKKAREMSFHVETHNGEKFYCKSSAPTASHISRQECFTEPQMAQFVQQAARNEDEIARHQQQNLTGGRSVN